MGLLAVILAMLAHWACYLFSWASLACLLHLLPLVLPMGLLAIIPAMLVHWPC